MPLADYLPLYRRHRAALLADRRGGYVPDHPLPVATTWSLSFQAVEAQGPAFFHSEKALRDQPKLIPKSHHEKALENRSSGLRKLFVSKHFDGKPARSMHIKSPGMNPSGGLDLKPIRLQALIDLVHLLLT